MNLDDADGYDTLQFGEGLESSDLWRFTKENYNLVINIGDYGDTITLSNWFNPAYLNTRLDCFSFVDGTSMSTYQMAELADRYINNSVPVVNGQVSLGESAKGENIIIDEATLLSTASDADGDTLSVVGLTVSIGTLTYNGDNTWNYTPDSGYSGEVVFSYFVDDDIDSMSAQATLTYVNTAPVFTETVELGDIIVGESRLLTEEELLANASDADGDALSIIELTVDHGTLTNNGDGTWNYSQETGYIGSVIFNYLISDGESAIEGLADVTIRPSSYIGTSGDDVLNGDDGSNVMNGLAGADILTGEGGNDWMRGGLGDDELYGGTGNDSLIGDGGADLFNGGDGRDTANYRYSSEGVNVNLLTGVASGGDAEGDTLVSIENLSGSEHNDILAGDAENNTLLGFHGDDVLSGEGGNDNLQGREGNDELYGGDGNDFLRGGEGSDILVGGEGRDSIDYRDSEEGVAIDLSTDLASGGTADGDTFSQIENVYGSEYNDILTGDAENNTLLGFQGDDVLSGLGGNDNLQGREGNDELYGGEGNDFLRGGEGSDILVGGEGRDSIDYRDSEEGVVIDLSSGLASGGTAEGDTFSQIENVYGSEHNDILTGDAENNTLLGFHGDDILSGLGGNDNLQGREGNDELYGGEGNDFLRGGAGLDILVGGEGRDSIDYRDSEAGVTIDLSSGLASGGTAEGDTFSQIENVYGSEHNDILTGDAENNTLLGFHGDDVLSGEGGNDNLQGREGNDELYGGEGNDFLRGGEGADTLIGGEGRDSIDYRDSEEGVVIDLSSGLASGGTAAGDTFSQIENVYGSEYNDTLTGDEENNTLARLPWR